VEMTQGRKAYCLSISRATFFLIVGGLYWVTALRKTGAEVKVYTKHQGLTQASKHHKQSRMRYSPLRRVSGERETFSVGARFLRANFLIVY